MHFHARLALALACLVANSVVLAQTKAPEPDYTLSYNASVVSDYRYRGISQTRLQPAVQGGVDFSHKSGLYLGTWASSIKWITDNNVPGNAELDLYGGYKGTLGELGYDLGVLRYEYLGNDLARAGGGGTYVNASTTELYAALTLGAVTAKYSQATTDLFGNYDFAGSRSSSGSGYFELNANFELGSGWSLAPHVGAQTIKNIANASYTDYSLTLAKDIDGLVLSAMLVGTDANQTFYVPGPAAASTEFLGKSALVLGLKKNF